MLQADRYVVYGVVTEYCVKFAALGLLNTGKRVEVATDAICALNQNEARKVLDEFRNAGGALTTAADVV
jgi:nicotinamidase/pyrazinamidase